MNDRLRRCNCCKQMSADEYDWCEHCLLLTCNECLKCFIHCDCVQRMLAGMREQDGIRYEVD